MAQDFVDPARPKVELPESVELAVFSYESILKFFYTVALASKTAQETNVEVVQDYVRVLGWLCNKLDLPGIPIFAAPRHELALSRGPEFKNAVREEALRLSVKFLQLLHQDLAEATRFHDKMNRLRKKSKYIIDSIVLDVMDDNQRVRGAIQTIGTILTSVKLTADVAIAICGGFSNQPAAPLIAAGYGVGTATLGGLEGGSSDRSLAIAVGPAIQTVLGGTPIGAAKSAGSAFESAVKLGKEVRALRNEVRNLEKIRSSGPAPGNSGKFIKTHRRIRMKVWELGPKEVEFKIQKFRARGGAKVAKGANYACMLLAIYLSAKEWEDTMEKFNDYE